MNSVSKDVARRWEVRKSRAQALQGKQQAFVAAMRFYEVTLEFQRKLALLSTSAVDPELPIRVQIDISLACAKLPALLSLAIEHAPDALRARAEALKDQDETDWREMFQAVLHSKEPVPSQMDTYFVRASTQPIAENLQSQIPAEGHYAKSTCPGCEGLPQAVVLRAEGEGASRSLLCSFCLREWLFRRILCPFCGEEDKDKLPRYAAEELNYVHVEACDTCKRYLKAIDLSIDGRAVPLVDEAATAVLDVWAAGQGYTKIIPNLLGF